MDQDVKVRVARQHLHDDEMDACEKQCILLANGSGTSEGASSLLLEVLVKKREYSRAICFANRLLKVS